MVEVATYDGDVVMHPRRVVRPESVEEIQEIVRNRAEYPGPVRAIGSLHSLTHCVSTDGTLVDMKGMNRVVRIDPEAGTVTAQAGAQLIDVARELRAAGLQFRLNIEIGNLTLGSAACCQTKDALDGVEFGQLTSYVTRICWVDANGELREASEDDPQLLRFMRSSYGLAGILYEVTFRVQPLQTIQFTYRTVPAGSLTQEMVDALIAENEALVCWTVGRRVVLQTRNTLPAGTRPRKPWLAAGRRLAWNHVAAYVGRGIQTWVPTALLRRGVQNAWFAGLRLTYRTLAFSGGFSLYPPDKTVDYSQSRPASRYAFTYWAFPRSRWVENLRAYLDFSDQHFKEHGFRCNMPLGSYYIRRDQNALLSYTHDGDTFSIDPIHAVSARDREGWRRFLQAFNDWSYARGGTPLLNQSPFVRHEHVVQAFGDRWQAFAETVRKHDPEGRFRNDFFRELLGEGKG